MHARPPKDDLCHNVLTGKVLPPAPIGIPSGGSNTLNFVSNAAGGTNGEGFTLYLVYDDYYTADVSCTGCDGFGVAHASCATDYTSVSSADSTSGSGSTPPDSKAGNAVHIDNNTAKQTIGGQIFIGMESPNPAGRNTRKNGILWDYTV